MSDEKKIYLEAPYLQAVSDAFMLGYDLPDRTGVGRRSYPGVTMHFDLSSGHFPAVTTKKLAFKPVVAEFCAFMRGATSAADFRALGTKIWDQNANENNAWLQNPFRKGEDDLGPVYGAQWRKWPAYTTARTKEEAAHLESRGYVEVSSYRQNDTDGDIYYKAVDQIKECLDKILNNPTDRRILFHAWNPAAMDKVALPPCHLLYQFLPNPVKKTLSMTMYQRSSDAFLGIPFNIASCALMLSVVAKLTGYTPDKLIQMNGDFHIYHNHLEQVDEMLSRQAYPSPTLWMSDKIKQVETADEAIAILESLTADDFRLENYQHHEAIAAPMAV